MSSFASFQPPRPPLTKAAVCRVCTVQCVPRGKTKLLYSRGLAVWFGFQCRGMRWGKQRISTVPGKDKKWERGGFGGKEGGICAQSRLLILFHTDAKYRSFQTTKKLFLDHPCNVSTLASDVISHFHFFVNSCFFLDRSQTFWKSCDKGLKSFFVPRVSQT